MFEWDDVTRHWWRYDKERVAMVHRASGEVVAYKGALPEGGWHRFDYEHEDGTYPLFVQMKEIKYRNLDRRRYETTNREDTSSPEFLEPQIWRIDHQRSMDCVREQARDSGLTPPYWLWKRADIAIIEAGLLWPIETPVGEPPEEISLNAGWVNGAWRESFYRRVFRNQPLTRLVWSYKRPVGVSFALPISDHVLTPRGAQSACWKAKTGKAVNGYGRPLEIDTLRMEDDLGRMVLSKPVDARGFHAPYELSPLTTVSDAAFFLTGAFCSCESDYSGQSKAIKLRPVWIVEMRGTYAIGPNEPATSANLVYVDGKPLVPRDCFFETEGRWWEYDAKVINHPLSSLRFWRTQFDVRMNALPFCPGFEAETDPNGPIQGDFGTVEIRGGFIGGLQGMTTQIRLKLRLPEDTADFGWQRFF